LLGDVIDTNDALGGLGGSAYLQQVHGRKTGLPPRIDLVKEKNLHDTLRTLIRAALVKSAHDCTEGGIAVAIAESCISNHRARGTDQLTGAAIDLAGEGRLDALLFGETQGRIVISVSPANLAKILTEAKAANVTATKIGTVGGNRLTIKTRGLSIDASLEELHDLWWNSIARAMA
jgi:phosphoribosylformylglycinamidine (FGAM) synthase-like enzyme